MEIAEPVRLHDRPVYRFRTNPELGFLESELFRYSQKTVFEGEQGGFSICSRKPGHGRKVTAQKIRRLVREMGIIIGISQSFAVRYVQHTQSIWSVHVWKYQIPVFVDYKKSILLNAFVEYVRSLLAMAEKDFSYESVFRFL